MRSRPTKLLSRIRGGGVVVSKSRLAQEHELPALTSARKLRVVGLPNRKAAQQKLSKPRG